MQLNSTASTIVRRFKNHCILSGCTNEWIFGSSGFTKSFLTFFWHTHTLTHRVSKPFDLISWHRPTPSTPPSKCGGEEVGVPKTMNLFDTWINAVFAATTKNVSPYFSVRHIPLTPIPGHRQGVSTGLYPGGNRCSYWYITHVLSSSFHHVQFTAPRRTFPFPDFLRLVYVGVWVRVCVCVCA